MVGKSASSRASNEAGSLPAGKEIDAADMIGLLETRHSAPLLLANLQMLAYPKTYE
jgi:hypothetical protein